MNDINPDFSKMDDETLKNFLKDHYSSQDYAQNLSDEPEKLSLSPYEIVFNVTANVLQENEKGEKLRSKHISTKFYHIPVPVDGDYNVFMESFFKFLEENLASAANKAYEENNPYKK